MLYKKALEAKKISGAASYYAAEAREAGMRFRCLLVGSGFQKMRLDSFFKTCFFRIRTQHHDLKSLQNGSFLAVFVDQSYDIVLIYHIYCLLCRKESKGELY